jgi:hypothetical protein
MTREIKHCCKHGPHIEHYVPQLGTTVNEYLKPQPTILNKRKANSERDLSEIFNMNDWNR